jgi:chromosome segregation ATPase
MQAEEEQCMAKTRSQKSVQSHFDRSIAQLSPSLQREMRELRKQEARILKLLSDPKKAEQYLSHPLQLLQSGGIEVPTLLKRRLQQFDPNLAQHLSRQTYALPNGQAITAHIRVRFTRGPREGSDAR